MKYIIDQTSWQEACNGIRCCKCSMSDGTGACRMGEYIQKQPVYEERPHGEWIYHAEWYSDGECAYECSRCGMGSDVDYNFCPNCGADMREGGKAK